MYCAVSHLYGAPIYRKSMQSKISQCFDSGFSGKDNIHGALIVNATSVQLTHPKKPNLPWLNCAEKRKLQRKYKPSNIVESDDDEAEVAAPVKV